eukprot:1684530-Pleurochrysis_carterae.AAC.1
MLEENDRVEGKNAVDAKGRAIRTKTVSVGDDMSSLRNELRQLREQMVAMTTTKSVMRTTTSVKPCDKCNLPHCGVRVLRRGQCCHLQADPRAGDLEVHVHQRPS